MTRRAFILGLVGAALVCGVTFYNDMVIRGSFLVGCYLPNSVSAAVRQVATAPQQSIHS